LDSVLLAQLAPDLVLHLERERRGERLLHAHVAVSPEALELLGREHGGRQSGLRVHDHRSVSLAADQWRRRQGGS
jgi:hypothetical protein